MKRFAAIKLVVVAVAAALLAGCILVPVGPGYHGGRHYSGGYYYRR